MTRENNTAQPQSPHSARIQRALSKTVKPDPARPTTLHTRRDGTKAYYMDGKLSRDDGPALEHPNGATQYYRDGLRHRDGGPAVNDGLGTREWFFEGKRHNDDGPAIVYANGDKRWFIHGRECEESELGVERLKSDLSEIAFDV